MTGEPPGIRRLSGGFAKRLMTPFGLRMSGWLNRCRSLLLPAGGVAVIRADATTGVRHVLADARPREMPLIWVSLDAEDVDDAVSVGNKVSRALESRIGSSVLGYGTPIDVVIAKWRRIHYLLGPHFVVVSNGHLNHRAVACIGGVSELGSAVHVLVPEDTCGELLRHWFPSRVVEPAELLLSDEEAADIADGLLPDHLVAELLAASGRRFNTFTSVVRERLGLPPLLEPILEGLSIEDSVVQEVPFKLVFDSFRRRGASIEAFEACVHLAPDFAPTAIGDAGPQYSALGLSRRMLRNMELLPSAILHQSDDLMRWWFAGMAVENRLVEARVSVESVLAERDAPELRAMYAAALPGPDVVTETERAVKVLETPITLRMHGFALGLKGACDVGLNSLMKALRMAEALGDAEQVVATATDIANVEVRRGRYSDGVEWAMWAVEQHHSMGGRDELRRIAAVSLLAFARMLTGDLFGVEGLINELRTGECHTGAPTSEVIASTIGDWYVISDDLETAAGHYRRNLEAFSREQHHIAALDLVPVLRALRRYSEARAIGGRSRAITASADRVTWALGHLAYALSVQDDECEGVEETLHRVCEVLGTGGDAYRFAQASIALSRIRLKQGDSVGARVVLNAARNGIKELGETGWRLLAGVKRAADPVWTLLSGRDETCDLRLLGPMELATHTGVTALTLRNAECVATIASVQDGLSLSQLTLKLYGDKGCDNTTKALISRLRRTIPLSSRPYRIAVPYRADFLELLEHLRRGHVRQALNLYRGSLLPTSEAPAIVELREHIDEALRQAVLSSGDWEAMLELDKRTGGGDLELLEAAERHVPPNDPQAPLLRARIRQIRRDWEV